jgi:ADP-dependent NAD(P)H-hydrate dehydratase
VTPSTLDLETLARWPMPTDEAGDKYSRGTVVVIGGSASTPGATILSGTAALKMGAGRLQIATDASVTTATAVAMPEALVQPFGDPSHELIERIAAAQCILVGSGLTDAHVAEHMVRAVLERASSEAVAVIDANALEILGSLERALLEPLAGRLVLTPNRQELAKLLSAFGHRAGDDSDESDDVAAAADLTGAVVASFGEVAAPDGRRWRADAGHPGLGTSGSGDVLAGLVAGVAARTGDAAQAACWGSLAHQLAGERLGRRAGQLGFLARELIDEVAPALAPLNQFG